MSKFPYKGGKGGPHFSDIFSKTLCKVYVGCQNSLTLGGYWVNSILDSRMHFPFPFTIHPGLTTVRSIRFLLFEIKRVLVYSLTIFKLTGFLFLLFHSTCICRQKKCFRKRLKNDVYWVKLWSKVTAFWNIDRTVKSTWLESSEPLVFS